jgi:hypothetical protein
VENLESWHYCHTGNTDASILYNNRGGTISSGIAYIYTKFRVNSSDGTVIMETEQANSRDFTAKMERKLEMYIFINDTWC